MPEGPEVEVIREGLLAITNELIEHVLTADHKKYLPIGDHVALLQQSMITNITRYGKFLVFTFSTPAKQFYALNHLGMTGSWRILQRDALEFDTNALVQQFRHYKLAFLLQNHIVIFNDIRTFGRFEIYEDLDTILQHKSIKNLGPDILDSNFDVAEFILRMKGRRRTQQVGKLLLNSHIVAGCGNIYKSESLFLAKILPTRQVHTLTDDELQRLANSLTNVGQTAFNSRGSTLKDYSTTNGYAGFMQNKFAVYGREGEPCINCQTAILKITQGGRSSFYCPKCQN